MKNQITIKDCGMLNSILNFCVEEVAEYPESPDTINIILNAVQAVRVTMLMETNRLQSLYLCEMLQSYSIQSQRYTRYDGEINDIAIFNNSKLFTEGEQEAIAETIKKCRDLYLKMTELKEGSENKTKFTIDDFKHGIPVEDGRFILPLAICCNKECTFEGINFFKLLKLFETHDGIFPGMYEMLMDEIIRYLNTKPDAGKLSEDGERCIRSIIKIIVNSIDVETRVLPSRFFNRYCNRLEINRVCLLKDNVNKYSAMRLTGAAALMCTTGGKTAEEVFNSKTDQEFKKITERVSGVQHHTSIAENASYTFLMKMSIACYNQYVRARHQQCLREEFDIEETNIVIVPQTITDNGFEKQFNEMCNELFMLICKLIENTQTCFGNSDLAENTKKNRMEAIKQLYPMGTELRILCTTNLVNELINKAPKRACNKAQWEIAQTTRIVLNTIAEDIGNDNKLLEVAKPGCCTKSGCPEGKGRCKDNSNVLKIFGINK